MPENQYKLTVIKGETTSEDGAFFKAIPFTLTINNNIYECTFEKGSDGHVNHIIRHNNNVLCELIHPDYVPLSSPETLIETINTPDAYAIFAAFIKLGISKEPNYQQIIDSKLKSISYSVNQDKFFS